MAPTTTSSGSGMTSRVTSGGSGGAGSTFDAVNAGAGGGGNGATGGGAGCGCSLAPSKRLGGVLAALGLLLFLSRKRSGC